MYVCVCVCVCVNVCVCTAESVSVSVCLSVGESEREARLDGGIHGAESRARVTCTAMHHREGVERRRAQPEPRGLALLALAQARAARGLLCPREQRRGVVRGAAPKALNRKGVAQEGHRLDEREKRPSTVGPEARARPHVVLHRVDRGEEALRPKERGGRERQGES